MSRLIWDQDGTRTYETGLDRGVLFLSDGRALPWNGLTSIIEKADIQISSLYYDGVKIQDHVVLGEYSALMKAVTYPDEFFELQGLGYVRYGVFLGDQVPQVFDLSYRTLVGDDLQGEQLGYKLHIVYNLTALPHERTYATISADPSLVEFEWDIYAVPDETPGFRPTAHIVLDSRHMDPWLLEDIEDLLYGGEYSEPALPSLPEIVNLMTSWYRWKVIDNGDGTYTLKPARGEMIIFSDDDRIETDDGREIFQALGIYVVRHADGSFTVYDTYDINDVPVIRITDNGDGTWSAEAESPGLIAVAPDGYFTISQANAVMTAVDKYKLSDTKR